MAHGTGLALSLGVAHLEPCVFERYPGAASRPLPPGYRPRRPQQSVLHRVVREHLETFLAQGREQSESGEGYPYYVEKELRDYLLCGDMSRGFTRVRCGACGHELLLPFSCKRRGICPSCSSRRMSDEAAWLVDAVLPQARYRQWTLTFPFALRLMMARDHRLITSVFGVAMRILFAWQRRQARRAGHPAAQNAAVLALQRFGGAMNLNVHGHALVPDGVFVLEGGHCVLVPLAPPEEKDLLAMTARLARRVTALLERRYQSMDEGAGEFLDGALGEAMSRPALPLWTREEEEQDAEAVAPRPKRCASVDGFSIHAGTAVSESDRLGLEKLCRYGLRPAFSHQRLWLAPDGKVIVGLRKPWPTPSGARELLLEPLVFLRRLASLTPPPYAHLIRHYGLFAPGAKGRDLLPPAPPSPHGPRATSALRQSLSHHDPKEHAPEVSAPAPGAPDREPASRSLPFRATAALSAPALPAARSEAEQPQLEKAGLPVPAPRAARQPLPWHELLRRVFAFDVLVCPRCAGPMTVLAYLTQRAVVEKILAHLGLPISSPPLCPARRPEQAELFENRDEPPVARRAPPIRGQAVTAAIRGPPSAEPCPASEHGTANDDPHDGGALDLEMDWGA